MSTSPTKANTIKYAGFVLVAALTLTMSCGDGQSSSENSRWSNDGIVKPNVDMDFNAVVGAYKDAESAAEFEKKVNDIYKGKEIISVRVQDVDPKNQKVIGFFDENANQAVDSGEAVFNIDRKTEGENVRLSGQGHGAYGHMSYGPSMFDIAAGVFLGSMIANAMMRPSYARPYTTSPSRRKSIQQTRVSDPKRSVAGKPSRSGRSYGRVGNSRSASKSTSTRSSSRAFSRSRSSGRSFGRSGGSFAGIRQSQARRRFRKVYLTC